MAFDADKHKRSSARLKTFDYTSNAAYFITVCTFSRQHLFGEIIDGEMQLNDFGQIVTECWDLIPVHFPNIELDAFIVMPDHVHGIVVISQPSETTVRPPVIVGALRPYAIRMAFSPEFNQVLWVQLYVHSNLPQQNTSMNLKIYQAHLFGNAVFGTV